MRAAQEEPGIQENLVNKSLTFQPEMPEESKMTQNGPAEKQVNFNPPQVLVNAASSQSDDLGSQENDTKVQKQQPKTAPLGMQSAARSQRNDSLSSFSFQRSASLKFPTSRKSEANNTKILIFIKPWDDEVFLNFISLLEYIELMEIAHDIEVTVVLPEDLIGRTNDYIRTQPKCQLKKKINTVFSPLNKNDIDYIITLGGDGTLLWAAKNYNTG